MSLSLRFGASQLTHYLHSCDLDSARAASWWCPSQYLRLSPFAAQVLSDAHKLDVDELRPHRIKSYQTRAEYADPLSGTSFVCLRIILDYTSSFGEMLVNPVKGLQHNVTAIPLGMANIVGSISEGTRNLPKSYGSAVRRVGEIRGWKSGLRSAAQGLYFGVQDGLTGLVTEPLRGAEEEVSSSVSSACSPLLTHSPLLHREASERSRVSVAGSAISS